MNKIVILESSTVNPGDLSWEALEKFGKLTVYSRTTSAEIIERAKDADILFTNKCVISDEVMAACPNLKYIGELATGYNNIDIEAAKRRGIPVCNVPAYSSDSVAQMTFALLLEACQHVGVHDASVKSGDWAKALDFCYWKTPLIALSGKTMGIIGFGRIGQTVAKIAKAFGMNVLAYGPHYKPEMDEDGNHAVSLDELLAQSDVISLNCPLNDSTHHIINAATIAKMKSGVILINTARGPLVDESAVIEALDAEKIGCFCTDVAAVEPLPEDYALLKAKNLIITPHIAWAPKETRQRLIDIAVKNLEMFLEGTPQNVVNA